MDTIHTTKDGSNMVKDQVRLVVGDLECVLGELRSVVVDLKELVGQIDQVTSRIDMQCSSRSGERSLHGRRHSEPVQKRSPVSIPQSHSCHMVQLPPGHVWHVVPEASCVSANHKGLPACLARSKESLQSARSLISSAASSCCKPKKTSSQIESPRSSTHNSKSRSSREEHFRSDLSSSSSSCIKKPMYKGDDNNNMKLKSGSSNSIKSSSSSSSGSSLTSHTSGSYSLNESEDSLTFHYDAGYDPWRKLSLLENEDFENPSYDFTRVIKKSRNKTSSRKASMAYSVSPSHSSPESTVPVGSDGEQGGTNSPSSMPDYDGLYEKEMDEKLELEFDDDLELFETIENGIHGTTGETETPSNFNASYNRDINTWRQYSGVSMETISDDLWSDYSDTNSEDILNDNFVIPLMSKVKRQSTSSCSANNTQYHWRTYVEP